VIEYVPILLMIVLLAAGAPIYLSLGVSALLGFWIADMPLLASAEIAYNSLTPFTLLAVPFFVITANLMGVGGISASLVRLARAWVGHYWGGLGVATVLACTVFSAISGSSVATALAVGAVTIPAMVAAGYHRGYAMGVTAAGGTLGILIPPSIPLILYGFITNQSVIDLFSAALIPGILAATSLLVCAVVVARVRNYPRLPRESWTERWAATRHALPSLLLPVLILGGIYSGAYTATEAAIISVGYSLAISQIFYERITFEQMLRSMGKSMVDTSLIMVILAAAMLLGHYLSLVDLGGRISAAIQAIGMGKTGFLFLIMGVLFILGTFMEVTSMLLIMLPMLLPAMAALGVNPIHFSVLFVIAMEVGLLTPPVGMNLYVVARAGNGSLQDAITGSLPYVAVLTVLAVLILLVPAIALWLPAALR
jgi:C4-dicarboxylate transporter DctM subunit